MMKLLLILILFSLTSLWASVPQEEIDCFTNMSDGFCAFSEDEVSFHANCRIDVVVGLKTGERIDVHYEGKSSLRKNEYALFLNPIIKDKAIELASVEVFQKIKPFYTIRTCD